MSVPGRSPKPLALAATLACFLCGAGSTAHATERVEVIGTSPMPGQGVDRDLLPYTSIVLQRSEIDRTASQNTLDLLARRAPGVQVNEIQGSPFQGDLTYRGYRASALLGAAQGLSVYLDGVRMNEPFGDVVNWDLLPEFAFGRVVMVGGANPAFGLNTLGGALVVETQDGRSAPGLRGEFRLGSFGRRQLGASTGSSDVDAQHYLSLGVFRERGWRDHSDGELATLLAKASRRTDLGEFGINLLGGSSRLVGNGLVPLDTYDEDGRRTPDLGRLFPRAVYTHPDQTRNQLAQASMKWTRAVGAAGLLEVLVHERHALRRTLNGDEAEEVDGESNAAMNRTHTTQRSRGVTAAWSARTGAHQWQAGLLLELSRVTYRQTEQEGRFDVSRGVVPDPAEDEELSAAVIGRSRTFSMHATDTWRLTPDTALTGHLRWNESRVSNTLTSVDDDTDEVRNRPTERFTYRHWSPSLGLTHRMAPTLTAYANTTRNLRVPTVIELGCADPAQPCRLPIGLQSDPYLKPVQAVTQEVGLRWRLGASAQGSISVYRTDNRDDILFSSVSITGQRGYFRNFDRTRHQGLDLEAVWRGARMHAGLAYSLLDATYQSPALLRIGQRNLEIAPGMRIAGLPRHLLKASVEWRVGAVRLGLDSQWTSRRVTTGNEDGHIEDDEPARLDLPIPATHLLNVQATWSPRDVRALEFMFGVRNLLDRRSASFGALAETVFDAQGRWTGQERSALFVAPGAPRALSLALRWRL